MGKDRTSKALSPNTSIRSVKHELRNRRILKTKLVKKQGKEKRDGKSDSNREKKNRNEKFDEIFPAIDQAFNRSHQNDLEPHNQQGQNAEDEEINGEQLSGSGENDCYEEGDLNPSLDEEQELRNRRILKTKIFKKQGKEKRDGKSDSNREKKNRNEKLVWMSDDEILPAIDQAFNRSHQNDLESHNQQGQNAEDEEMNGQQLSGSGENDFYEEGDLNQSLDAEQGLQWNQGERPDAGYRRKEPKRKRNHENAEPKQTYEQLQLDGNALHQQHIENQSFDVDDYGYDDGHQQNENEMKRFEANYLRKELKRSRKERKIYEDMKKDMAATNRRIDVLDKELKTFKSFIKRQGLTRWAPSDDDEEYDLLPRLPLKKVVHILLMDADILNNREYKKQLLSLLRTEGGSDIKKNVINIFKILFSSKLKTKLCWKGSKKGKRKHAFEPFKNILSVIRQAVKYRHKQCSAEDIKKECTLRFKQAKKDYDREKAIANEM